MSQFRIVHDSKSDIGYTIQERTCFFFWFDLVRVSTLKYAIDHIAWVKEDRKIKNKRVVVHEE